MIIHKLNFTCGLYWHILRKKETTWTHISECESMVWRRLGWIFMDGCFCIVYCMCIFYYWDILLWDVCVEILVYCMFLYICCMYILYVYIVYNIHVWYCLWDVCCVQKIGMDILYVAVYFVYCMWDVCVSGMDTVYCTLCVCVCRRLGWIYCIFTRSHG